MKKPLLFLIAFLMVQCIANADTAQYSDDIISFEYDDSIQSSISSYLFTDGRFFVSASTLMMKDEKSSDYNEYTLMISQQDEDYIENAFLNTEPTTEEIERIEIVSAVEPYECIVYLNDGVKSYQRIIGTYENYYAIQSLATNNESSDKYKQCKLIFDSMKLSNGFFENGLSCLNDDFYGGNIYNNVVYSKLVKPYLEQAIVICDAFLSSSIDAYEAKQRISSLESELAKVGDSSQYVYDSSAKYLLPYDLYFDFNNDGGIITTETEIQNVIDSIE